MENINIKTGDLIVGNRDPQKPVFSQNGTRLTDGVFSAGSENDLAELQESVLSNAVRAGGKVMNISKTGVKKIKNKKTQTKSSVYAAPTTEELEYRVTIPVHEIEHIESVVFENSFGRMRVTLEHVLEQDLAFLLVFKNASQVIFEPKIGETLDFSHNQNTFKVYYPGVIFDWTDGVKKGMILFKIPDTES
jgi:hypothetical protein